MSPWAFLHPLRSSIGHISDFCFSYHDCSANFFWNIILTFICHLFWLWFQNIVKYRILVFVKCGFFWAFSGPATDHLCFPKSHWTAINTWRNLTNRLTSISQSQYSLRKLYAKIETKQFLKKRKGCKQQKERVTFLISIVSKLLCISSAANYIEWQGPKNSVRFCVSFIHWSGDGLSFVDSPAPANCGPGQMTACYRMEYSIWHTCQKSSSW